MLRCLLGNSLWRLANARAYRAFRRAWREPRRAQENILFAFLRRNAASDYGRRHRYATIRTVRQFQEAVPIVNYEDLVPRIEQIRQGRQNVLTCERVLMMEKTSGSAGGAKYIPYTATLRREFQNAVGAWMFDLFTRRPALKAGAQYWSISPSARQREFTPGGLPVGFDDDTEYLGVCERLVLRLVMAVPGRLCRVADIEENRRITLAHLRRCRHLAFVSVWNPSFLTILMSRLPAGSRPRDYWPGLRLISCWTSGVSSRFIPELRALFPGVEIQGKGLLATEGVVSFPEIGRPAPSPALTSHFLEFLGDDGRPRLVDELAVGDRYRVLLTTGGGLARYAPGDCVEVVAPGAIEFVGRADNVSDICGEKLSETFVGRVLEDISARRHVTGFAMLAPEWSSPPRYLLIVDSGIASDLAGDVEKGLRASVHYDYCRRLGQLGPVQEVRLPRASERYQQSCAALGQRVGNIKPAYLRREFGWQARLEAVHG
jgi:hypothetical protein